MLFDKFFFTIAFSFLSFAWFKFYIDSNLVCILASTASTLFLSQLLKLLTGKHSKKKALKRAEKKQIEKLLQTLALMQNQQLLTLFFKALEKNNILCQQKEDCLQISTSNGQTILVLSFDFLPLSMQKLSTFVKNFESGLFSQLVVFASSVDIGATKLKKILPFEVKIFDIEKVYAFLKKSDSLPALCDNRAPAKQPNFFLAMAFSKKRAKFFLSSSVFLLATSFLTFFPVYYLASGTVLFVLFLYAQHNKKYNSLDSDEISFS